MLLGENIYAVQVQTITRKIKLTHVASELVESVACFDVWSYGHNAYYLNSYR